MDQAQRNGINSLTPGRDEPADLFRCVVSVSENGRRFGLELQGAVCFFEEEMAISSRRTLSVIADLFLRFSYRYPKLRERMRFPYGRIVRIRFTGERRAMIELDDGRAACIVLTYLNRGEFTGLLQKHGLAFEPYAGS